MAAFTLEREEHIYVRWSVHRPGYLSRPNMVLNPGKMAGVVAGFPVYTGAPRNCSLMAAAATEIDTPARHEGRHANCSEFPPNS